MATMDIIKLKGGDPANFLDVGGSATEEQVRTNCVAVHATKQLYSLCKSIRADELWCDRLQRHSRSSPLIQSVKQFWSTSSAVS